MPGRTLKLLAVIPEGAEAARFLRHLKLPAEPNDIVQVRGPPEAFRTVDICARWGGEEFLVVLCGTDAEGALLAVERARAQVAAIAELPCVVTVSAGLAERDPAKKSLAEATAEADKRLYSAKASGRNRVVAAVGADSMGGEARRPATRGPTPPSAFDWATCAPPTLSTGNAWRVALQWARRTADTSSRR